MISKTRSWPVIVAITITQLLRVANGRGNFGTTLYTWSDVERNWTDDERTELRRRMSVGPLVPTRIPDDGEAFLAYFALIKNRADTIDSVAGRKRTMIAIVDAIGGYLHARMLPQARLLYYDGKSTYSTTKRLHDLAKAIKYVLGTDGRGWARPSAGQQHPPDPQADAAAVAAVRPIEEAKRCGGIDAGPYGLLRRRSPENDDHGGGDVSVSPYFDNDTRPTSLVVPWQPHRPVLYSVRDAGCHRVLFDHCVRSVGGSRHDASTGRHYVGRWLDAAVRPLVTREAVAATGRWYPALWGASVLVRHLGGPLTDRHSNHSASPNDDDDHDRRPIAAPNANLYAAIVLASTSVCWMVATLATFAGRPPVEQSADSV